MSAACQFDRLFSSRLWRYRAKPEARAIVAASRSTRITTEKTIQRANLFKIIKDKNPRLSYTSVAMKATAELGEEITKDDVRNAYRAMGWEWERGNRVW